MIYGFLFLFEIASLYWLSRRLLNDVFYFLMRTTKSREKSVKLLAWLFLPGTFFHESAHFLMSLLLLVPVGQMELVPQIDEKEEGIKMGSIPIGQTDPIRLTLIGIAPFLFGIGIVIAALSFSISSGWLESFWVVAALGYLVFQVGNTMFSSKKDLSGLIEVAVIAVVLYITFLIIDIKIEKWDLHVIVGQWLGKVWGQGMWEIVAKANLFLLVPVLIDLVGIMALRKTNRR